MTTEDFLQKIKLLLPDFELSISSSGSIHGVKKVPLRTFRNKKGTIIKILGIRNIFISSVMGTDEKPFYYCTVYTVSQSRGYRCKNWYDDEYNKVFISGRDYNVILDKFKENVEKLNY